MRMIGEPPLDPPEVKKRPICPVCGSEEPEDFYVLDGDIIGCTDCVERIDPWDWAEQKGEL